ncbi:MAG TPA: SDR family oxidoreductase [Solirubrobacterales bacterium]|nr:SDR family oxidoreductase [Solirubrobacterales bacterium]
MAAAGDLDGRVIVIAGAAGGLGPVVAERLAAAGATLALGDLSEGVLGKLGASLELPEDRLDLRAVDLLKPDQAEQWAGELEARFERVDAVLHLVGGWRGGDPLERTTDEDYEWLHDLLVGTTRRVSQAFYGPLNRSGQGRFVLVSSTQAQAPDGTNASYAATKASAESWTLALANSFAADGCGATANIIVVNAILTPEMREEDPGGDHASFTSAEDIADACAYLCSDAAAKMNGGRMPLHP